MLTLVWGAGHKPPHPATDGTKETVFARSAVLSEYAGSLEVITIPYPQQRKKQLKAFILYLYMSPYMDLTNHQPIHSSN